MILLLFEVNIAYFIATTRLINRIILLFLQGSQKNKYTTIRSIHSPNFIAKNEYKISANWEWCSKLAEYCYAFYTAFSTSYYQTFTMSKIPHHISKNTVCKIQVLAMKNVSFHQPSPHIHRHIAIRPNGYHIHYEQRRPCHYRVRSSLFSFRRSGRNSYSPAAHHRPRIESQLGGRRSLQKR